MKQDDSGKWIERTPEEIDEKFKIGFIQTPQSFYNRDLFQEKHWSRWAELPQVRLQKILKRDF